MAEASELTLKWGGWEEMVRQILSEPRRSYFLGICYAVVHDRQEAEDCLQSFLLDRLPVVLDRYVASRGEFTTYVTACLKNFCRDRLRLRCGQRIGQLIAEEARSPRNETEATDEWIVLEEAMQGLTKRLQEHARVIEMYYFMELSVKEIAEKLSISEALVKSRLHRARQFLRKQLGAWQ